MMLLYLLFLILPIYSRLNVGTTITVVAQVVLRVAF